MCGTRTGITEKNFLRVKVELDTTIPLRDGFRWTNSKDDEKWATIRYERLSDYCYGCGRLGHTLPNCEEEVARAESDSQLPRYGPWLTGVRPRTMAKSYRIGGHNITHNPIHDDNRQSWKEVMASVQGRKNSHTQSGQRFGRRERSDREVWSQDIMQQQTMEDPYRNAQGSFVVDQKERAPN